MKCHNHEAKKKKKKKKKKTNGKLKQVLLRKILINQNYPHYVYVYMLGPYWGNLLYLWNNKCDKRL